MTEAGARQAVTKANRRPSQKRPGLGGVGLAALIVAAAPYAAWAQTTAPGGPFSRDKSVGVRDRAHPEYSPIGMHMGAFTLEPQVQVDIEHNDNIYGSETNQSQDTIYNLTPSITAKSNWSQHALNLYARSRVQAYTARNHENNVSYEGGIDGRIDIVRSASVTGLLNGGRFIEARTSPAAAAASATPIVYNSANLGFGATKEFNRLRFGGNLGWNFLRYNNGRTPGGLSIDQSFRDRTLTSLSGRADYAMTPDTAVFVEVDGNWRDYRRNLGLDRNSHGDSIRVGANFELTNLIRGDIGVGWLEQKYDSPLLSGTSGLSVQARVEWFPTQLTTVTFTGSRDIQDSGLIGSAGYTSARVGATVDHELLRNLIITGNASYEDDTFISANRQDRRSSVGVAATYLMNRGVGITGGYSFLTQDSSGLFAGPDFNVNDFTLGIILKY
jgi:hypothetical protein